MTDVVHEEGATVEEAIEKALEKLGVARDEAEIEVVREPSRGFLGLGGEKALVNARKLTRREGGPGDESDEITERAREVEKLVAAVLDAMDIDSHITIDSQDDHLLVAVEGGPKAGLLIGKRGETLAAIQTVVNAAVRKRGAGPRVVIDIEGYRARRRTNLEQLALRAAEKATASGRAVALGPMNSYERRVVHLTLKDDPDVVTESEGDEPDREVIVVPR
ncbi:MAG: RNA-binding cell elongation regulator Jag/EloR [Candidatus Aquicultorales bacterium]